MYGSNLRQGDDREGCSTSTALVSSYPSAYPQQPAPHRLESTASAERLLSRGAERTDMTCAASTRSWRSRTSADSPPDTPRAVLLGALRATVCARLRPPTAEARATVVAALAGAVATFVRFAVPLTDATFDAPALWTTAWQATYGAEVRPSARAPPHALYASNATRFEVATALALDTLPWATKTLEEGRYAVAIDGAERSRLVRAWRHRRLRAKGLFLLRMLRNGLIFENGVDCVLWKIQRHSGVPTDRAWRRKTPSVAGRSAPRPGASIRAGAFR